MGLGRCGIPQIEVSCCLHDLVIWGGWKQHLKPEERHPNTTYSIVSPVFLSLQLDWNENSSIQNTVWQHTCIIIWNKAFSFITWWVLLSAVPILNSISLANHVRISLYFWHYHLINVLTTCEEREGELSALGRSRFLSLSLLSVTDRFVNEIKGWTQQCRAPLTKGRRWWILITRTQELIVIWAET